MRPPLPISAEHAARAVGTYEATGNGYTDVADAYRSVVLLHAEVARLTTENAEMRECIDDWNDRALDE